MKRQIKAEIVCGSLNEHGQKITTWVLTYPRIIHAEMMTHRVFSRNAASSRAIPALKMIADIESDPFIPVAWQKNHKGMQGTEYFEEGEVTELGLKEAWLVAKGNATTWAKQLTDCGTTKQLTNRLLEPFQWYTAIFTTTETENFFNLRCPQYNAGDKGDDEPSFKSRKDYAKYYIETKPNMSFTEEDFAATDLDWLKLNKGQGEIHISLLAEAMWDSMNEYDYKQLKAGEWHIPFGDRFEYLRLCELPKKQGMTHSEQLALHQEYKIKIATARCARVSYNNFEGKDDYEADIKLYDILKASGHFSPFEHCARAQTKEEYHSSVRGELPIITDTSGDMFITESFVEGEYKSTLIDEESYGWSNNFRGFVQLRAELC